MTEYKLREETADTYARQSIDAANRFMSLYFKGCKDVAASKYYEQFINNMNYFLFGENRPKRDIFEEVFSDDTDIYWNEYLLAYYRMIHAKQEEISAFECDHTANFVDWYLAKTNIIRENDRKEELRKARENFINSSKRYFSFAEEKELKKGSYRYKFYINARLAEKYMHCVKNGIDPSEFDMYTPFILSRMAVEQYLKAEYFHHFQEQKDLTAAAIRKELEEANVIAPMWSNELQAVQRRGNTNTHDGDAGDTFAIIHGIQVLIECWKRFPNC